MFQLRAATYLISGSGSLLMGIMLLALKSYPDTDNPTYSRVKRFLAYTAFIDVLIDAIMLYLVSTGNSQGILNTFVLQAAYYCQLFFMSYAGLTFVHTDIRHKKFLKWALHPLAGLSLLFMAGFVAYSSTSTVGSTELMLQYCRTGLARTVSYITDVLLLCEILIYFVWMSLSTSNYIRKVGNFFSGEAADEGVKVNRFAVIYITFFLVTGLDIFITSANIDALLMMLKTVLGVHIVVFIFNMSPYFLGTVKRMDGYSLSGIQSPACGDESLEKSTERAISRWANDQDKPYLQEGLVLADVARQLELSETQLSYVLNHSLGLNFNTWINRLRIGEAKRILMEEPQTQISDIAYRSGFSDITVFSRNFKKEEGITASEYRRKILA